MTDQSPTQEQAVKAIYTYGAQLMKSGLSNPEVANKLVEMGLDEAAAKVVTDHLATARAKALREAGQRNMLIGGLICLAGIVVTLVTFAAASGGGTYIIAWGAIIFGGIQFFRGFSQASP